MSDDNTTDDAEPSGNLYDTLTAQAEQETEQERPDDANDALEAAVARGKDLFGVEDALTTESTHGLTTESVFVSLETGHIFLVTGEEYTEDGIRARVQMWDEGPMLVYDVSIPRGLSLAERIDAASYAMTATGVPIGDTDALARQTPPAEYGRGDPLFGLATWPSNDHAAPGERFLTHEDAEARAAELTEETGDDYHVSRLHNQPDLYDPDDDTMTNDTTDDSDDAQTDDDEMFTGEERSTRTLVKALGRGAEKAKQTLADQRIEMETKHAVIESDRRNVVSVHDRPEEAAQAANKESLLTVEAVEVPEDVPADKVVDFVQASLDNHAVVYEREDAPSWKEAALAGAITLGVSYVAVKALERLRSDDD